MSDGPRPQLMTDYRNRLKPLLAAARRREPHARWTDVPDRRVREFLGRSSFVRTYLDEFGCLGVPPNNVPSVSICGFNSVRDLSEEYTNTEYGESLFGRNLFPIGGDGGGCQFQVDLNTGEVYHMDLYWKDEDPDEEAGFERAVMQRWPSLAAFCDALENGGPWEA